MDMSQETAFVTGGTGKIGRHLVSRLVEYGFRVRVLTHRSANPWSGLDGIQIIKGDISDGGVVKEAINACDYIFHLAVYQDVSERGKALFQRINVEGTKTLLANALSSGVRKIVYVSTAMVFKPTGKAERDESWPKMASAESDNYLQTKIEALAVVNRMKESLPIAVVYPTAVMDLRDFSSSSPVSSHGIQKFLWEKIGKGVPGGLVNLIGPKDRILNYVIVEDVVEGIIKAALDGPSGGDYILGGENITAEDYLKAVARRMNKKPFPFRIPFFLFRIMAFLGRFAYLPPVIAMIAKNRPADMCFSSERAGRLLKYNPLERL